MGSDIRDRFAKMSADRLREQVEHYRKLSEQAQSVKSPYHWIYKAALEEMERRKDESTARFRRLTKVL